MPSRNRVSPQAGYIKNLKSDRHPRGPNGRLLCRWCQVEVPKGRRTFCSDACVHEWNLRSNPAYLRDQVFRRDRGVCAECGRDCEALYQELRQLRRADVKQYRDRAAVLRQQGFNTSDVYGGSTRGDLWQADHIVPVAEGGGECGLDNLRTLCSPCHKAATAALRKRLAEQKRGSKQLNLLEADNAAH